MALLFIIFAGQNGFLNSNIELLNNFQINVKYFIFPISFLTIVGLSNAVNLTDGLDGLSAWCSSIVFCGLGTELLIGNNENNMIFVFLCYSMAGLCLGFLNFNKYPAKLFMGDTGSISIGAILGLICVITSSYLTTFLISGIFILETFSVIIQVSYFKLTKKIFKKGRRIFLMSPLHHHLCQQISLF